MALNSYSQRWHKTFSRDLDGSSDAAFLAEWLPPGRILDLCCGYGRHMRGLAERGWEVVGLERDPEAAAAAGALCLDLRELDRVPGVFDGVISMWASFGYFSDDENRRVLDAMRRKLVPSGRLVLELYNREFFELHQGVREIRPGVVESKRVHGRRLNVRLDYGDGSRDELEWQAFTPAELRSYVGMRCLHEVSDPGAPRMLFVFG
jgi:SAM-dependent methyltransferase